MKSSTVIGLACGTILLAALALPNRTLPVQELALVVMSFNVRWDGLDQGTYAWTNRRPVAVDVIRRHAPDVVAFQEPSLEQTGDLAASLEQYAPVIGAHERDQHLSLLYRTSRFELTDQGSFWLVDQSELSGGTRRCVWIRLIERETGLAFYVFNNHWDHRSPDSRRRSAQALLQGIRERQFPDPFLVTGDFNEVETGAALKMLTQGPEPGSDTPTLVDSFRALHPADQAGTGHRFIGRRDGARIDYIFASSRDRIQDARILYDNDDGRYPSDHFPVVATIRLAASSE